jgi:hypothetical protein
MPFIVKSQPKQHIIEYQGGVFVFDAPNDQQSIQMYQAVQSKDFAQLEPLFKLLLSEVREVQDQDGKALTAKQIKGASSLGGTLALNLLSKLIVEIFKEREAEEKNG